MYTLPRNAHPQPKKEHVIPVVVNFDLWTRPR